MATTIFDRLRSDHDKQRTLMQLLLTTSGDSEGRRELFARLREALEVHAAAEERAFYAPLLEDKVGRSHAAHSVHEHEQMRDMLEELAETSPSSSSWLAKARQLVERNTHHIDEEEREIFPVAGRVLSAGEKEKMASTFDEMRSEAEKS